jgi:diaminopimelate epimerase
MKKLNKKLSLNATTVRLLHASLREVVGRMGPNTAFVACHSQEKCDESHAATCGNGSRCV